MTDTARLVISVDSSGATKATAALDKLDRAAGNSEKKAYAMGRAWGSAIRNLVVGGAIGTATVAFIKQADTYALMSARLGMVTKSATELKDVQAKLFAMAQTSRTDLQGVTDLYVKLANSSDALRGNQELLLSVTDKVSKALTLSGADAASASAVIRQFSQAMASGALRGDEFVSVMEGAPRLARAMADGLGVPIGALRAMAAEGKLTADTVIEAIQRQGSVIDAEFGRMPLTVSGAVQKVKNSLLQMIGQVDETSEATRGLSSAVDELAKTLSDPATRDAFATVVTALVTLTGWAGKAASEVSLSARIIGVQLGAMAEQAAAAWEVMRNITSFGMADGTVMGGIGKSKAGRANYESAMADLYLRHDTGMSRSQYNAAFQSQFNLGLPGSAKTQVLGAKSGSFNFAADQAARSQAATATLDPSTGKVTMPNGGGSRAPQLREEAQATKELTLSEQEALIVQKSLRDVGEDTLRISADAERAATDHKEATARLIEDLDFELSLIGKTNLERQIAIKLRRAEATEASAAGQQIVASITAISEAEKRADTASQWADGLTDTLFALRGGLKEGEKAFTAFIDSMIRDAIRAWMNKQLQALLNPEQGGGASGGSSAAGGGFWSSILTGIGNMVWGGTGGPGYAMGGYTGPGGLFQPAGVVHKGEVVFSQADVAKAGGVAAVEAMRKGRGNRSVVQNVYVQGRPDKSTLRQMERASGRGAAREMSRTGR